MAPQSASPRRLECLLALGAHHHPLRTALTHFDDSDEHHVSYLDLWTHVRHVSAGLQSSLAQHRATPTVALFLPTSLAQVVATLAVLTAGAAFVPLALDITPARCKAILEQTRSPVVLTDTAHRPPLVALLADAAIDTIEIMDINQVDAAPNDSVATPKQLSPKDPAYVLFSSGTTGTPKGIVTPHSAVISYCDAANNVFKATAQDSWLRAASYTFDVSIEELFVPFSVGARVVIQSAGALNSLSAYIQFLDDARVTVVSMPTALWHQLAKHVAQDHVKLPKALRLIVVGGEAGMTDALNLWHSHVGHYPQIVNAYGPTETTVSCTLWEAEEFGKRAVMPIGRPLPTSICYVLDSNTMNRVAPGAEGVLHVAGPGLATGYLGNPKLTAAKFLPNPFSTGPGYETMYNTGDLVIEDERGVLHFCGRTDLQVQVRGFRVEVEAIEACLLAHPAVKSAAVISVTEQQTVSLHAYVVQADGLSLNLDVLLTHCQESLAHYEVPARFFRVSALPLNQSGKIDRRVLVSLSDDEYLAHDRRSEQSALPNSFNPVLARLWCESLDGVSESQLSADSHFVRLGGHSLTLITLGSKISSVFNVSVTTVELLRHLELDQMSLLIADKLAATSVALERPQESLGPELDSYPLTLPQERLFSVQQNSPNSPFFNDGLAIDILGTIEEDRLLDALKKILTRHPVLRGRLVQLDDGRVEQKILAPDEELFRRVFVRDDLDRPAAERRAYAIFAQPIDLFVGPLVKVALLSSGPQQHILVICAHHIIWDGFSDNIFLNELVKLYQGTTLPPAPNYFKLFDRSPPDSVKLAELKSYLADVPQTIDLPNDFVRPDDQSYSRGGAVYFDIDAAAMAKIVRHEGGSFASASLTAFAVMVHLVAARQTDFMVGVPFANRVSAEAARAIGFFVNLMPVRMSFEGVDTLKDLYSRIQGDLLSLAEREDVPFDALVGALGMNRFSSRDSLLQVSFAFQDAPDGTLSDQVTFSRFPLNNGAARTDITCFVEVSKNGHLTGEIEYNTDLFAHSTMESMAHAINQIVESWANHANQSINSIPFKAPMLSALPLPKICNQSLGSYLSAFGERFAQRDAVYEGATGRTYTFSQLFTRARQIQNLVRPYKHCGDSVMLLVSQSVDALAAEIGVSLAGLSWIPCDVGQPKSRICAIAGDARPACVLADSHVTKSMEFGGSEINAPLVLIPSEWDAVPEKLELSADHASEHAYIIYTSGTTGKPKGVTICHESIIAFLNHVSAWAIDGIVFNSILTSNVAFDGSICQMYSSIVTGGLLKMPKVGGEQDGEYLSQLMKQCPSVNFICTTSAAVRMWLDQLGGNDAFFPAHFQQILLGGDALTPNFARRVLEDAVASPKVQLKNVYGPTEGTVFSSYGILSHTDVKSIAKRCRVPIDQLMPHVEMSVSAPDGRHLPRGFVGEIIIWGPCLTPGYYNLPSLNAERFLTRDGMRGWRSGDLGRQLPCGRFEILGRMDTMCKVRGGFRVELAEIEAQIATFEQVAQCHVSVAGASNEEKQIIAHVVFHHDVEKDSQVVADWKEMFEGVNGEIKAFEEQVDLGFDYRGWTSSFDRKHISANDMSEWINTTVERILGLECFHNGRKPRVLEIGSGTGMILFRVAPRSAKYTGLDLSEAVVTQVQAHAKKLNHHHVEVHVSPAHLFEEVIESNERFDLVICNSVAQYFPSFRYLQDLMNRVSDYIARDGYIFLGDLRNFSLSRQFATAVSLANRPQSLYHLENGISNCMRLEEELLVTPDYFTHLARDDSRFTSAVTLLRDGYADTEMNLFRFDAVIRLAGTASESAYVRDLKRFQWTADSFLETISWAAKNSVPILLQHVPNGRIADLHLVSTLPLDGAIPLAEVLHLASSHRDCLVFCRPERALQQIRDLHIISGLPICSLAHPESFDLLVYSRDIPLSAIEDMAFTAQLADTAHIPMTRAFSNKSRTEVPHGTLRSLHDHLSRRVPAYMLPDFVIPMEAIPLTSSHKVDKLRLVAPEPSHRFVVKLSDDLEWTAKDIANRTTVEAILRIFSTVLSIDKSLSPHDDFFASGGHSLIATKATSMIRRELDVALPFTSIIMCPTASSLAARVESIRAESSACELPPHIVLLHQARVALPRNALFVFHPLGGGLAPLAPLVNRLSEGLDDLAIYGVVWEPESGLDTVDNMALAYAASVAAVTLPDNASRYLLGWSFGGMIAAEAAARLPAGFSQVVLLDAPTVSAACNTVQESDFAMDLFEHMLEVLMVDVSIVSPDDFLEALQGIDRKNTSRLASIIRNHLSVPTGLPDGDLERFVSALSENFEILLRLKGPANKIKMSNVELNIILNLQATLGLCTKKGMEIGLGWRQYAMVESDHDGIINSPDAMSQLIKLLGFS